MSGQHQVEMSKVCATSPRAAWQSRKQAAYRTAARCSVFDQSVPGQRAYRPAILSSGASQAAMPVRPLPPG